MFVKQIGLKEAMELAAKGREVMVMAPSIPEPKQWGDYCPDTVQGMLSGCMFFRREPAMADPVFGAAVEGMERPGPPLTPPGSGSG